MIPVDGSTFEEMLKKAKGYALRLFKLRPRTEDEFKVKFASKGYPDDVSCRVVSELKALGYINDAAFARVWMQSRLKKAGFRRVAMELAQKGITKEAVSLLWDDLKGEYDELAVARDLVERRIRLYIQLPVLKRKKRVMDYLSRRGFSADTINKVIRNI